jgi:uncharacterized protein YpbB
MSRLTVRLPETLHRQLRALAKNEEISLNQYIVYALTRQVTLAYTVQAVPEQVVVQQQAVFTALLQSLGQASFAEIEAVMSEREKVEPDPGLSPDVVAQLQARIANEIQSA